MEITRTSPPSGLPLGNCRGASKTDFNQLTKNLTTSINQHLDIPLNVPITIQTLDSLMKKFWSTPLQAQTFFCSDLWNTCEQIVSTLAQNTQRINKGNTAFSSLSKSPVIFSTREGLDITLDLKSSADSFEVDSVSINPGGSSINVGRALNNFGTSFQLIGIKGTGAISNNFAILLEKEGINSSFFVDVDMDTRFHMCLLANKNEHWIVSLSPNLVPQELDRLTYQLMDACKHNRGQVLALANNPPAGAKAGYMPEVIKETRDIASMFVIYDTKLHSVGKDLLDAVLLSAPGMIKPNLAEYSEIVGVEEEKLRGDKNLIVHLAQELTNKYGIKMILVSLDKDGAMLIDKDRAAIACAPPIEVVSTIGAGDTGIAAMIDKSKKQKMSFRRPSDNQFKEFLRAFVAAGCATVKKPGTELATLKEVQDMEKDIKVRFV